MITALDENIAFLVIDMQNGVLQLPVAPPIDDVLLNVNKLIALFRKAGKPIVLVNVNPGGAAWTKARKNANPTAGKPQAEDWADISPKVNSQPDDIYITKHTWSAFYETALHDELQKRKITNIVLAGVATSIGVEGTARAASERAYNITLISDAMADMFADAHINSMQRIFPRIGEVGTTDEFMALFSPAH